MALVSSQSRYSTDSRSGGTAQSGGTRPNGHSKQSSSSSARIPVPPLLGNAPPFLETRSRSTSSGNYPPRTSSYNYDQHQAMLIQQAQYQQQQWQIEMMRTQQPRRRATSGPAPSHPYRQQQPQRTVKPPVFQQHASSSSSSSNSNSSHARTDSTASSNLSARNFPPKINTNVDERRRTSSVTSPSYQRQELPSPNLIVSPLPPSPTPSSISLPSTKKPSPLSQQTTSAEEGERPDTPGTYRQRSTAESEEESDDTAMAGPAKPLSTLVTKEKESKGMKGRFKKAFSIGSDSALPSIPAGIAAPNNGKGKARRNSASSNEETRPTTPSTFSKPPPSSSTGKRLGIFSTKLPNASTDNVSISSTVSSASVMLRKLSQFGTIARRSSLMSLTKAFKSSPSSVGKDSAAAASTSVDKTTRDEKKSLPSTNVSRVTVELDSPSPATTTGANISPAAALAKRHQALYAEQERVAIASSSGPNGTERGFQVHERTASDAGSLAGKKKKWGFGTSQSSSSIAGAGVGDGQYGRGQDSDERSLNDSIIEVRGAPIFSQSGSNGFGRPEEIMRESGVPPPAPRRDAKPTKGILKGAGSYNQEAYAFPRPSFPRTRANSAEISSTLRNRTPSHSPAPSVHHTHSFMNDEEESVGGIHTSTASSTIFPAYSNTPSPYNHPSASSSLPSLQQLPYPPPPAPSHSRKLSFAPNLSVHTTWPAEVYDRRAEVAACNRLTPAFAQRIKEELNCYKMEEMRVHESSRGLTHFFV